LQKAFQRLVAPGKSYTSNESVKYNYASALTYVKLLEDLEKDVSSNFGTANFSHAYSDEIANWWTNVIACGHNWLSGENTENIYMIIENIPKDLLTINDPLPKAVLAAYECRKCYLENDNLSPKELLRLCNHAGQLLDDSLNFSSCKEQNVKVGFAQLLICDWLLETRTSIWEDTVEVDPSCVPVPESVLSGFQKDVTSLKALTTHIPSALARVFLYEATARLMAGAAPGRTQQILDRSLRHRHSKSSLICGGKDKNVNDVGGERQHAAALYLACKHLPGQLLSLPGERAGMLQEAAKTLERIGDKKRLQDCYKLMKTLGPNSVTS